ncbi:hypothetical protein GCM10011571_12390 [Marinithermofilum abyssi]|uniref:Uncharacterized protein n=1 Tax=Marinithermofilum abyssi TaxID=1571185 RepID=A0A8J2VFW2_9BACL|nr:hypothetical protein GCM10011571_12390 [Marinithermofilum abyssi]
MHGPKTKDPPDRSRDNSFKTSIIKKNRTIFIRWGTGLKPVPADREMNGGR